MSIIIFIIIIIIVIIIILFTGSYYNSCVGANINGG